MAIKPRTAESTTEVSGEMRRRKVDRADVARLVARLNANSNGVTPKWLEAIETYKRVMSEPSKK